MKLLIADDEVQIRTGLAEGIDWSMFDIDQVYSAANGTEAWELYNRHLPDIVITDIRMPGMDGLELSRAIKRKTPSAAVILLSGYADFQYAKEAIQIGVADYELKPVKLRSLIEMVKAAQHKLLAHRQEERERRTLQAARCLEKLALGEQSNFSMGACEIVRYLTNTDGSFVCMALEWDGYAVRLSALSPERREQMYAEVGKQLLSRFASEEYVATDMRERRFYVLCRLAQVYSADSWEASVRQWHWDLNGTLTDKFGITVSLGMSAPGPVEALLRLMGEACGALNGKLVHGGGVVFRAVPGFVPVRHYPLPLIVEQKLAEAVLHLDVATVNALIDRQFEEAGQIAGLSREGVEELCVELLRILYGVWPEERKEERRSDRPESSRAIFLHYEIMQTYKEEVLRRYMMTLERQRNGSSGKHTYLIAQATDYIRSHYKSELTVETLAEVTGITPNYFSHLFNKEVGVPFREYLNRLRIDEAKQLLRSTNLLAYEVMDRVGFQNYKYFCQVFKKSEGCSPSDYRKHAVPGKL